MPAAATNPAAGPGPLPTAAATILAGGWLAESMPRWWFTTAYCGILTSSDILAAVAGPADENDGSVR